MERELDKAEVLAGMWRVFIACHGPGIFIIKVESDRDGGFEVDMDRLTDERGVPIAGERHILIEHDSVEEAVMRNQPSAKGVN